MIPPATPRGYQSYQSAIPPPPLLPTFSPSRSLVFLLAELIETHKTVSLRRDRPSERSIDMWRWGQGVRGVGGARRGPGPKNKMEPSTLGRRATLFAGRFYGHAHPLNFNRDPSLAKLHRDVFPCRRCRPCRPPQSVET